eukprot:GSChrysophyteH1.ASY1.ANO1.1175.1 assembled CDS
MSDKSEFYFMQRRGKLKLRSFAAIDLEKVVREDVKFMTDPLLAKLFRTAQLMIEYLLFTQTKLAKNLNNLATRYSSQKESLLRKRHELAELKALVSQLEDEVSTKKQGITALESILVDNSKARREVAEAEAEVAVRKVPDGPADDVVCFYVVDGSVGLCVEFNEDKHEMIHKVLSNVRDLFSAARTDASSPAVKLVYRGVVLSADATLAEAGVREGDTVVAVIVSQPEPEPQSPPQSEPEEEERRAQERSEREREMKILLTGQEKTMRGMTEDLRRSFE